MMSNLSRFPVMICKSDNHTILIGVDMLPRQSVLVCNLILEVSFTLLQRIKLLAQLEDSFLGRILALLSGSPAEPRPHGDIGVCVTGNREK
jgi:hypothetical protein